MNEREREGGEISFFKSLLRDNLEKGTIRAKKATHGFLTKD